MTKSNRIPVVDIFAGPGGLGEGFSQYPYEKKNTRRFDIRLSIEKDPRAHQTLLLRSFRRQFPEQEVPKEYYELLKDISRPLDERLNELYIASPEQHHDASQDAICAELGNPDFDLIVSTALARSVGKTRDWVLLGGPPCQAYSLAGRSRNKGKEDYVPSEDNRQFLYREYLKVIAKHLPSVFVMENVKGLLSATLKNKRIFKQIIADLKEPRKAVELSTRNSKGIKSSYRLFSILQEEPHEGDDLSNFVIKMEDHGIPQKRHRLIILGVREDLDVETLPRTLEYTDEEVDVSSVLTGLPPLRSGLSKSKDRVDFWKAAVRLITKEPWFKKLDKDSARLRNTIEKKTRELVEFEFKTDRGNDWVRGGRKPRYAASWYCDSRIGGLFNHQTRGHMESDLHRYMYAACYASINKTSPVLKNFPKELRPNHKNVEQALKGSLFADRFRVQRNDHASTTITCHISKDGHYYIHPDPAQCRSLTVREAARLQTFPDNYFFCGPRTSQYTQVGNAVPPLLSHQIAEVVYAIMKKAGKA